MIVPWASYLVAALLGIAQAIVVVAYWGLYIPSNPIIDWLSETLAQRGYSTFFSVAIYSHDFILNLILAAPFMLFVSWLRPGNSYRLMWITIAAFFLLTSGSVIFDVDAIRIFWNRPSYYFGVLISLVPAVLAYRIIVGTRHDQSSPDDALH